MNSEPVEQEQDCLTIENFNTIVSFIEEHGEEMKISERLLSDKTSLAVEISVGSRFVLLENNQDYKKIIVIDKNKVDEIPVYFVSDKNGNIHISAYYSRFDTDENIEIRVSDWCDILLELSKIILLGQNK